VIKLEKTHTSSIPSSNLHESWNFDKFKENLKIKIIDLSESEIEFDLIGVDASLANAFRRILLAEIPTMAIEKVFIYNNTSVIKDEILAHRLGLIPLNADANLFEYKDDDGEESAENTLVFELNVACTKGFNQKDNYNNEDNYKNSKVFSKSIKWTPIGDQASTLKPVKPLYDDILVVKMRPGHKLDIKMHAVKGLGKDHAKFSPVATASYRLLPEIKLLKKITDADAYDLKNCFSPGVIKVVKNEDGEEEAVVIETRQDTCTREVLNYPKFDGAVKLGKVADHFIFSIESCVDKTSDELFVEAVKVLMSKCEKLLVELDEAEQKLDI